MTLIKKFFSSLKGEGLIYTFRHVVRYLFNPVLYKIRPFLMKRKKKEFIKKYNLVFPTNNNLLPADYLDLDNLVTQILKLKPKCVLELGTGYSTYAIIFALNKLKLEIGHKFEFYAVDQNEIYLENLKNFIPKQYSEQITFLYRPLYTDKYLNTLMSFFKNLPNKNFDFIYEDRHDHKDTKLAGDVIKFENQLDLNKHSFSLTIDGMPITTNYYKQNLRGRYKISGSIIHGTNFNKIN
jgi:hypothetical protein